MDKENTINRKEMLKVDNSLRKPTEGFMKVYDKLEGIDRTDDFTRLDNI